MPRCQALIKITVFIFTLIFSFSLYAGQFLSGTEDVPLMVGLTASEDETFAFDNEDGRLYFSKAYTKSDSASVWAFYRQTLPQLGWTETETGVFTRENDVLRIAVVAGEFHAQKLTSVIFELITK